MNGDIICMECDNIWKYDEDRDGYVKRPLVPFAVDPENGMYLCPCGKEADERLTKVMWVKKEKMVRERIIAYTERIKYYVCGECVERVSCHHCDKRTPKGNDFPECVHCGMYLDLVCIKGKMVSRYTATGKDRVALHEKS